MARFVVLDHSLTRVGGHHYEQAMLILRASEAIGLDPVLVTNRLFSQRYLLPSHWHILPLFPDESCDCLAEYPLDLSGRPLEERTLAAGASAMTGISACCRHLRDYWSRRSRERRIERFAAACHRLESAIGLREGDQVFIPTVSLFDLLGLARYLESRQAPADVVWHVCFHYGFLQGREPDYAAQAVQEAKICRQLHYVTQHFSQNRFRFYATTDKLARQFNRLGVVPFDVLPFPVDHRALQREPARQSPQQLRVTCAGYLRREKGKMWASSLVHRLWESELAPGHIQLVVQTNERQARRMLPQKAMETPRFRTSLRGVGSDAIVWLRHPLTREAYLDLIRASDIALFLHDGIAYYTRCSGVLVEMLAAGVPVLVPAGSWLADQVAESIHTHLEQLGRRAILLQDEVPWRVEVGMGEGDAADDRKSAGLPLDDAVLDDAVLSGVMLSGVMLSGGSREATCDIAVPPQAAALLVSLEWRSEHRAGSYLRLSAEPTPTSDGGRAAPVTSILSPRPANEVGAAFIPLPEGTTRIRLRICNAYDSSSIQVGATRVCYLERPAVAPRTYPAGSVGLVFADVDQLPHLVRNLREHYDHFSQTAAQFAQHWRRRHDAQQIVETLLCNATSRKAVA